MRHITEEDGKRHGSSFGYWRKRRRNQRRVAGQGTRSEDGSNIALCGSLSELQHLRAPLFISGEVKDWQTLAHRTVEEIESKGIRGYRSFWGLPPQMDG